MSEVLGHRRVPPNLKPIFEKDKVMIVDIDNYRFTGPYELFQWDITTGGACYIAFCLLVLPLG